VSDNQILTPGPPAGPDSHSLEHTLLALEERVRALEATVAILQDTRAMEARVAERVTAQVPQVSVASVVEALSTQPLPPAVKTMVGVATQPSTLKRVAQSSWLAWDMVQELIAVGRMLTDRRYHMAWITRVLVILFTLAILLSGFYFPLAWFDKVFDLLLASVLFLALYCETRRYKEWRNTRGTGVP
jgi:hypothetical protein